VALAAAWAFAVEPGLLVVRHERLWAPGLPTLKVALVSDLHAGAHFISPAKVEEVVTRVNAEKPDLILFLGDLLNNGPNPDGPTPLKGGFPSPEEVTPTLAGLRAPLGVYAVLGNHDWWLDGPRVSRALQQAGIRVLENEGTLIQVPGGSVWLVGVGDAMSGHDDVVRAFASVPASTGVLAFTHSPDVFPRIPASVPLTLAGHTHGGQVALPFFGAPIVPSVYGARYAAGHVEENGHHLFVTTGIGTSILPVRFGVKPEVVILEVN
jgi:predicted MPP superfamily phosphohydrolase